MTDEDKLRLQAAQAQAWKCISDLASCARVITSEPDKSIMIGVVLGAIEREQTWLDKLIIDISKKGTE